MLHFILAPYHLGQRAVAVGAGPLRIHETGVATRLGCSVFNINAGDSCEWQEINELITSRVRFAGDHGELPLVLAGNCNSCLGTLAAIAQPRLGVVWFDAHGDFHTPETSVSGSVDGMSMALATTRFVAPERVVLAGARDLDPGEGERVRQLLLHVPDGNLLSLTLPDCDEVYVHIDVDVLDPAISPGANFKGPGGLTTASLLDALTFTFDRYRVAALAIANYNPDRDHREPHM